MFVYLNNINNLASNKSSASTVDEFCTLDHLDKALATRAAI